jgi:hypothetical protein
MSIKKLRETQCDDCKRFFYRKLVSDRPKEKDGVKVKGKGRVPTQINDITYWTGGKPWKGFKTLCRACLDKWYKNHRLDFTDLVEEKKQKLFYHYRYQGLLSKDRELYKE